MRTKIVSLKKVINCGNPRWVVDRTENGKRKRSFFATRTAAEAEVSRLGAEIRDTGAAHFSLPANEREDLMTAWAAARDQGHDLLAVLRQLSTDPAPPCGNMTMKAGLEAYLEHLKTHGRSAGYVRRIGSVLKPLFAGRGTEPVSTLTTASIVQWMDGRKGWTRATMRTRVKAFCRHAMQEGWIAADPSARIPTTRIVDKTPAILSVDQHKAVLQFLDQSPRGLAWYVLSAMCGLRPGEAEGMTWENVILEPALSFVRVEGATSKRRQRRVVYIHPAAARWLKHAKDAGAVLPISNRRTIRRLRDHLGKKVWEQDITRHTAASYWLAETENAAAIAEALGNSVQVLRRHYRAVVTRDEAARFWAILPPGDETVAVDFRHQRPSQQKTSR